MYTRTHKPHRFWTLTPSLVTLLTTTACLHAATTYNITPIGLLGTDSSGAGDSFAVALSPDGTVIGYSDAYSSSHVYQGPHAFKFKAPTLTNLGSLGSSSNIGNSSATAINPSNTIIGYSEFYNASGTDLGQHAVVWTTNSPKDIGTLGTAADGTGFSTATAINNAGTVIGNSEFYDPSHNDLGSRAFSWSNNSLTMIPTLGADSSGFGFSSANAINSSGTIIGDTSKYNASNTYLGNRGFVWQNNTLTEIPADGTASDNTGYTSALAINSANTVLGNTEKYNASHADLGPRPFLWQNNTFTEIPTLGTSSSGAALSQATAFNDAGTVIGSSEKYTAAHVDQGSRGFTWIAGTLTEIPSLGTDSNNSNFVSMVAINPSGAAIGNSEKYDASHNDLGPRAFVWQNNALTELLSPDADPAAFNSTQADGITTTGIVWGDSSLDNVFIWSSSTGFLTPDQFIAGGLDANGWTSLDKISAITDSPAGNFISGWGTRTDGTTQAFLLTLLPTPEPSSLLLLTPFLLTLLTKKSRAGACRPRCSALHPPL